LSNVQNRKIRYFFSSDEQSSVGKELCAMCKSAMYKQQTEVELRECGTVD